MLVKTPAIKLAVEIRSTEVEGDRLTLKGVANNMPCSVQIGAGELRLLARLMLRRPVLSFALHSLIRRGGSS
jgi:hypothetical protein